MTEIELCNEHSGVCVRIKNMEDSVNSLKSYAIATTLLLVANLAGIITVLIKGVK